MTCSTFPFRATQALLALMVPLALIACSDTQPVAEPAPGPAPDDVVSGNECGKNEPWAAGFQADHCEMANGNSPPISPLDWPDVCTPASSAGWTPTQTSFDQLSWRSFLYNSWPANSTGQPDASQPIGAQQSGVFPNMVWQTYKNAQDLFGEGGAALTAADYAAPSPVPAGCDPNGPRVLTMTSKVPESTIQTVDASLLADASDDGALASIDQAFKGPLYPQGADPLLPVFYEIRINDTEYNAIVAAGAQKKSPDELNCVNQGPDCVPFSFPLDSTEVKAAWKALSADEVSSGRFFHQALQVVDPSDGTCSVRDMGLVGLHIARKVSHAVSAEDTRTASWAWSTFEHNDNVPPVGSDGSDGTYSFFNASCTPVVDDATCAQVAANAPNPDDAYQCCENLYRYKGGAVPANPTPNQVTRLDAAPSETQACNAIYDPLDKGVYDHYSLVVTQWPKQSDGPPAPPTITPTHARNAVIETYFTKWVNGQQVNTSSCMGCHGGSSAVDMSYLFLGNVGP